MKSNRNSDAIYCTDLYSVHIRNSRIWGRDKLGCGGGVVGEVWRSEPRFDN
jgi:hypothetical protein